MRILRLLTWLPSRIMVPLQYRIHTGRKLNLINPKRFTEKIQLYKLKYRNPIMLQCTDKCEVRKVVEKKGLQNILIPLIGIYSDSNEIDFNTLPQQFVAKTTDGGGGNQVLICRDKNQLTSEQFFSKIDEWLAIPKHRPSGREWAYENGYPRRIIIEELLTDGIHQDLPDYKFYCFDGKPVCCQLIGNRSTGETIDFYNMNWEHLPFIGLNPECINAGAVHKKPDIFDELKRLATLLSQGFPFVRVDLYVVANKPYFGELTFYPASGYGRFSPDEYDERLGAYFSIDF